MTISHWPCRRRSIWPLPSCLSVVWTSINRVPISISYIFGINNNHAMYAVDRWKHCLPKDCYNNPCVPLNSTFPVVPWSSHMMSTMLGRGLAVSKSAGRSLSPARFEAAPAPSRPAPPPSPKTFRSSTSWWLFLLLNSSRHKFEVQGISYSNYIAS